MLENFETDGGGVGSWTTWVIHEPPSDGTSRHHACAGWAALAVYGKYVQGLVPPWFWLVFPENMVRTRQGA